MRYRVRMICLLLIILLFAGCAVPPEELGLPATTPAAPTANPSMMPTATPAPTPAATLTATPAATPTATPTATPAATPAATPTAAPTATPAPEPIAFGKPLSLDLDGDRKPDVFTIHSGYAAEGATYAPHLTLREESETRASVPIFADYPGAMNPTILDYFVHEESNSAYFVLGQYSEAIGDYAAYELYQAGGASIREIELPRPDALLYDEGTGSALLQEVAALLCPAGENVLIRTGYAGPYALAMGEAGLTCTAMLYFLDPEGGQYAAYSLTFVEEWEKWQLKSAVRAEHRTGLGLYAAREERLGRNILTADGDPDFEAADRYPHILAAEGDYAVTAPAYHETGFTHVRTTTELQDKADPASLAALRTQYGEPLMEGDRFLLYPMAERRMDTEGIFTEAYCLFALEDGGRLARTAFLREEYGLTLSRFSETEAYCITVTTRPLGACLHEPSYRVNLLQGGGGYVERTFAMGLRAFLLPELGFLADGAYPDHRPGLYLAFRARDYDGDGEREYLFVRVLENLTGSAVYALEPEVNGFPGWRALEAGTRNYNEVETAYREAYADEIREAMRWIQ